MRQNGNKRWQQIWRMEVEARATDYTGDWTGTLECHLLSGVYIVDARDWEREPIAEDNTINLSACPSAPCIHRDLQLLQQQQHQLWRTSDRGWLHCSPISSSSDDAMEIWRDFDLTDRARSTSAPRYSIMYRSVLNNAVDHRKQSQNEIVSILHSVSGTDNAIHILETNRKKSSSLLGINKIQGQ